MNSETAIRLETVREVLRRYYRALCAVDILLLPSSVAQSQVQCIPLQPPQPDDLPTILVPEVAQDFTGYKLLTAHQAIHVEAGTQDFDLQRAATCFANLRPQLLQLLDAAALEGNGLAHFLQFFPDTPLAWRLFKLLEDHRVNARLRQEYPVLRALLTAQPVPVLPQLEELPLRHALLAALERYSSGGAARYAFPSAAGEALWQAAGLLKALSAPGATVEDAAEATLRAYCLMSAVPLAPNWGRTDASLEIDLDRAGYDPAMDNIEHWIASWTALTLPAEEALAAYGELTAAELDALLEGVPVELLEALQQHLETTAAPATTAAASEQAEQAPRSEDSGEELADEAHLRTQETITADEEAGPPAPALLPLPRDDTQEEERIPGAAMDRALCEGEPEPFLYPEWDHRTASYRPDWCTVWQRHLKPGDQHYFPRALREHHYLVSQVERRFEQLRPRLPRPRRGLEDGDDFDLDRVIQARVEQRALGLLPDRVYQRREFSERSVSILFLLDMSLSTSEGVLRGQEQPSAQGWSGFARPDYKRIIDVEKESLVLLTRALEMAGDRYGLYGFSGRGRHGVRFYVIKDIADQLSATAMARIETVAPVQATRMGPAIRHANSILRREPTKTRVLVMISDGQPQDFDYGIDMDGLLPPARNQREEREQEKAYALQDTHKALMESRAGGIVPFMLSVDRHGRDYLQAICGGMGYEVVQDISVLPHRLVSLYHLLVR